MTPAQLIFQLAHQRVRDGGGSEELANNMAKRAREMYLRNQFQKSPLEVVDYVTKMAKEQMR